MPKIRPYKRQDGGREDDYNFIYPKRLPSYPEHHSRTSKMTDDQKINTLLLELAAFKVALIKQRCYLEAEIVERAGSQIAWLWNSAPAKKDEKTGRSIH